MHLYFRANDPDNPGKTVELITVNNVDARIDWEPRGVQLPYRTGDELRIKIYDPEEKDDFEGDPMGWYLSFTTTGFQLISSDLYFGGVAGLSDFRGIDYVTCEKDHKVWEHDDGCYSHKRQRFVFSGLLELVVYNRGIDEDPTPRYSINEKLFKKVLDN